MLFGFNAINCKIITRLNLSDFYLDRLEVGKFWARSISTFDVLSGNISLAGAAWFFIPTFLEAAKLEKYIPGSVAS